MAGGFLVHKPIVALLFEQVDSNVFFILDFWIVLTAAALEERKTLKILPVEGAEEGESSGAAVQPTTVHLVVETSTPPAAPKRRRGRPRKVDQAAK